MGLAKSYARALLESSKGGADLQKERTHLEELVKSLASSRPLTVTLTTPVTSVKEKLDVISKLSEKNGYTVTFTRFLELLAKKNRMSEIASIQEALEAVRLEQAGGILGELVSTEDLSEADVKELAQAFSKKTGKKVEFKVRKDPSLLAGVKVIIGGTTYDGSLRAQLDRLELELSQGGQTQ